MILSVMGLGITLKSALTILEDCIVRAELALKAFKHVSMVNNAVAFMQASRSITLAVNVPFSHWIWPYTIPWCQRSFIVSKSQRIVINRYQ